MMKNNKGITLIALVITIIVLLILAGVSIAMLTGSNGILTQATNADKTTTIATVREKVELAVQAAYTAKLAANTSDTSELDATAVATQYESDNGTVLTFSGSGPWTADTTVDGLNLTITLTRSGKTFTVTVAEKAGA